MNAYERNTINAYRFADNFHENYFGSGPEQVSRDEADAIIERQRREEVERQARIEAERQYRLAHPQTQRDWVNFHINRLRPYLINLLEQEIYDNENNANIMIRLTIRPNEIRDIAIRRVARTTMLNDWIAQLKWCGTINNHYNEFLTFAANH